MTAPTRLGLFGGTFDPVHVGHLDAAAAALRALRLDRVLFIPSHLPPHREADPRATHFHRFAMVVLATNDTAEYRACDIEVRRTGTLYTHDTLLALHADGWPPSQLFFIIGTDAFAEIALWREFGKLVEGTNFAVVGRTGTTLTNALARTPALGHRVRPLAEAGAASASPAVYLIDAATRDVSSSQVRQELAAGQPIAHLVPEAVERHIIRHGLYGAVERLHGNT